MSTRRYGTKTITLDTDIQPGETRILNLAEQQGGVANKRGFLRPYLPFSALVVDSYDGTVRVRASIDGSNFDPVPPNSARTFDSIPVNAIHLKNPHSSAVVSSADLELILFTDERRAKQEAKDDSFTFSPRKAIQDIIPGL